MSSQDSTAAAQDEAEKAKIIQDQIEKNQADITAMQNDSNASEMQADIQSKVQVNEGLQQQLKEHTDNVQRLNQQAMDEQKQEQEDQRQQQESGEKSLGEAARDGIINNLF